MKVSVPGMPATLLNMSNNDIYKMVSGDKMDMKMNIFQRLWGNDSNLLIVFYVQIMPDDFVMQLHRF